jgi:hypothetical protein
MLTSALTVPTGDTDGTLDGSHPLRGPSYVSIPLRYCTEGAPYNPYTKSTGGHKLLASTMRAAHLLVSGPQSFDNRNC